MLRSIQSGGRGKPLDENDPAGSNESDWTTIRLMNISEYAPRTNGENYIDALVRWLRTDIS